ncbi:Tyrosyl-DNA phosphodiesterase 1 [Nymphon striatum]|nr:Tyrosyl-DNA phosphodiesterase 1 [Nymphon striatum]
MSQKKFIDISDSDATDCEEDVTSNQPNMELIAKSEFIKSTNIIRKDNIEKASKLKLDGRKGQDETRKQFTGPSVSKTKERKELNSSQKQLHNISDSDVTDCEDDFMSIDSSTGLNQKARSDKSGVKVQENKCKNDDDSKINNEVKKNISHASFSDIKNLPACKYGINCYRKNPEHLRNFSHSKGKRADTNSPSSASKKIKIEETKGKDCSSSSFEYSNYNLFLTKVTGISNGYNDKRSIYISEILSPENGTLVASVQFNYIIDIPWLIQKYPSEFRSKPLLIVHGQKEGSMQALIKSAADYSNISFCQAKLEIAFGTHHTKMMFLHYKDGFKVVIHTANLVEQDWNKRTQGVWISEKYQQMSDEDTSSGDSDTHFKQDLIEYISCYRNLKLKPWIELIKKYDFSSTKVHLIASVPGRFRDNEKHRFGHLKLRKILKESGPKKDLVDTSWHIIGQFSSIGSLGKDASQWLRGEWLTSLSTTKETVNPGHNINLKLVFPSVDDVRLSLEGYPAGVSLPYSKNTAIKQLYLNSYLHRWKSELHGRTHASPHIKSYMRVSSDDKELAWFLITSANLSKAAWGALEKNGTQLMIRSYELGVLFVPQSFKRSSFEVLNNGSQTSAFMIPFDLPLSKYTSKEKPWTWDEVHREKPDRHGNMWCPY